MLTAEAFKNKLLVPGSKSQLTVAGLAQSCFRRRSADVGSAAELSEAAAAGDEETRLTRYD